MRKNKLYVMCGVPGSGKSTAAKAYYTKHSSTTKLVSRDDIRFSLLKDNESYFKYEKQVFNIFIKEIKSGLKNGYDVIADATHLNHHSRSKLLRSLGNSIKNIEIIAVVIKQPLEICLKQNKNRKGTKFFVPENALKDMYENFEVPFEEEGFKTIILDI